MTWLIEQSTLWLVLATIAGFACTSLLMLRRVPAPVFAETVVDPTVARQATKPPPPETPAEAAARLAAGSVRVRPSQTATHGEPVDDQDVARLKAIRRQEKRLDAAARASGQSLEQTGAVQAQNEPVMAEPTDAAGVEADRVEADRVEAEQAAAAEAAQAESRRRDVERANDARREAERVEAARIAAEKADAERAEAERREARRLERERRETERREAERLEEDRVAAKRHQAVELGPAVEVLEAVRVEAERLEGARVEAERVEAARVEAERLEGARVEAERVETARVEAARLEAERLEAERLAAERLEAERVEAERLEAERLEAERVEAERLEAARVEAERLEAERLEAERVEAERLEAEPEVDRSGAVDPPVSAMATLEELAQLTQSETVAEAPIPEPLVRPASQPLESRPLLAALEHEEEPAPRRAGLFRRRAREDEFADDDSGSTDEGEDVSAEAIAGSYDPDSMTPYGPGSMRPRLDGSAPAGHQVKGNRDTMLFHTEESRWFSRVTADVWFDSIESAQAAGFTRWDRRTSATTAGALLG